ncbi:NAD(P)-dependent alcohol dehydrogenase [Candidatus Rhabdochlamydia sp. T3358]|uniref:NAD(P)-dependent alcohol dehydrogenase n=1 Tax=Candidatus Rhabdochlamydia sp. T3358 TaxID=2099795 RepID=UPI0010AF4936|nr:NAD(P)-dependent alcohol dehydrogenase [Candidatus Rhabdochlamydia sp. T3358]VHO02143.1 putative formaldehyde dehydrogenase AdhA [Candidatus Rhabdochlamydia sp. T3358]
MIKAYAVKKAKGLLEPFEYESKPLSKYDIELNISHCGVCYSDVHLIDNDWHISSYPLVPGHEIIGIITAKAELVKNFEMGMRVGIGWQGSSCMNCEWCNQGEENLCSQSTATCIGHFGGYAKKIIADARFAFPIPETLTSLEAAPLLCGGATVFSPFLEYKVSPTAHVGIIGIGGLGHLALQFAKAWGCEVTAISSTLGKKTEAEKFGAHHFLCTTDKKELALHKNSFDFLLSTTHGSLNVEECVDLLKSKGKLCIVGAPSEKIELLNRSLINGRKTICGSNIASRPGIQKMLKFAALHKIKPQVEEFPLTEVNTAIEKLRSNKIRYRAVLKIAPD